ncbi:hypothetical protein JDN40_05290 [Rhodomicrobium vannielii ATCC 17100]|uniref:hypothetical protein n=1 Tax=Rhodomicrobium vannielii TaxID=1069 RepID=UPI001919A1FE|nr:hypothetical protein [Rhodomicrobium vannielii]MBJ7533518.1 hypothetical protein [Rhodomicrobium vannielii ATCC 17100]
MNFQDRFSRQGATAALIERLNADLLSHPSATDTLDRWCRASGRLPDAALSAEVHRDGARRDLTAEECARLAISPDDALRYRLVRIFFGDKFLSEAENWYIPARLPAEMNRLLEKTQTPFGRVVEDLDFRRETLSSDVLWTPTADARAPILRHRAILSNGATPISLVVETYQPDVLFFQAG